jgi:hypothetical protein
MAVLWAELRARLRAARWVMMMDTWDLRKVDYLVAE